MGARYRLERGDARDILTRARVPLGTDFHALSAAQVESLGLEAQACRYRAPRVRNGSATRYFHAYLVRAANRAD